MFIRKIVIFIAPFCFLGVVLELLLRYIPNDYSYKKSYLEKNSARINTLFLGSSHAYYGIDPSYFKQSAFNVANVSQTLDYDYEILEKYDYRLDSLKFVVLNLDYVSLPWKLNNGVEYWRCKNYNIFFGINITNRLIDNSALLSATLKQTLPALYNFYIRKQLSQDACSTLGWATDYHSKNKQDMYSTGQMAVKRHTRSDTVTTKENINILKKIISFAEEHHAMVIFYTPPAFKTYVVRLDPKQLNLMINTANYLVSSSPNVIYYNLLTDPLFTENDFYDADHLNEIGAKKLSLKMDSLIRIAKKKKQLFRRTL